MRRALFVSWDGKSSGVVIVGVRARTQSLTKGRCCQHDAGAGDSGRYGVRVHGNEEVPLPATRRQSRQALPLLTCLSPRPDQTPSQITCSDAQHSRSRAQIADLSLTRFMSLQEKHLTSSGSTSHRSRRA